MTATAIQNLITTTLTDFGSTVIVVLTAVIGVSVAYLAFKFGWLKVQNSLDDPRLAVSSDDFNRMQGRNRRAKSMSNSNTNYDDFDMVKIR